ncbi:hypothetical protein N7461_004611 [Penicillium sp. DV-2018c]|nr:hypothetical protein N7461_004611 [Penicillium sp. DV-2018c]
MDKKRSRGGKIKLVRYEPEVDVCAHSRCPSPSRAPEKPSCTCHDRCEHHLHGIRSPSPNSSTYSGYEPVRRCCGGCHAIIYESGPSPLAEKAHCSCNSRCELHSNENRSFVPNDSESSSSESIIKCCGGCQSPTRQRRSPETRPTTPNSSDYSDYEPPRRHRGHRTSKRESEHPPQEGNCGCEAHTPSGTPVTASPKYMSARMSFAPLPRPVPMINKNGHHHCRKASYCETHPELCRARTSTPSPMPRATPTPSRSAHFNETQPNGRASRNKHAEPRSTSKRPASLSKQMPIPRNMRPSKSEGHRPEHRSYFYMDGYHTDDAGYYATYDEESGSEISNMAVPGFDAHADESLCMHYHRCRPRFECGLGWVCGRE